jgi:hypothetical protein
MGIFMQQFNSLEELKEKIEKIRADLACIIENSGPNYTGDAEVLRISRELDELIYYYYKHCMLSRPVRNLNTLIE